MSIKVRTKLKRHATNFNLSISKFISYMHFIITVIYLKFGQVAQLSYESFKKCASIEITQLWLTYFHFGDLTLFAGTFRWGEFGKGGLLWGECNGKPYEWFSGNPIEELLSQVCDF